MTFDELANQLPNGLHDMELKALSIDYPSGSMKLCINFWVGDLDDLDPEKYRQGTLYITGLAFCSMGSPDPRYKFVPDGAGVMVSGDAASPETFNGFMKMVESLPPDVSFYRFFVNDWNSFIHVAARNVELVWDASLN